MISFPFYSIARFNSAPWFKPLSRWPIKCPLGFGYNQRHRRGCCYSATFISCVLLSSLAGIWNPGLPLIKHFLSLAFFFSSSSGNNFLKYFITKCSSEIRVGRKEKKVTKVLLATTIRCGPTTPATGRKEATNLVQISQNNCTKKLQKIKRQWEEMCALSSSTGRRSASSCNNSINSTFSSKASHQYQHQG